MTTNYLITYLICESPRVSELCPMESVYCRMLALNPFLLGGLAHQQVEGLTDLRSPQLVGLSISPLAVKQAIILTLCNKILFIS